MQSEGGPSTRLPSTLEDAQTELGRFGIQDPPVWLAVHRDSFRILFKQKPLHVAAGVVQRAIRFRREHAVRIQRGNGPGKIPGEIKPFIHPDEADLAARDELFGAETSLEECAWLLALLARFFKLARRESSEPISVNGRRTKPAFVNYPPIVRRKFRLSRGSCARA